VIKPWLFEFFPELRGPSGVPSAADVERYIRRYLRLWKEDEALGFEGIFFSEHHFGGSFSPSPHLLIASSRTAIYAFIPSADSKRSASFHFAVRAKRANKPTLKRPRVPPDAARPPTPHGDRSFAPAYVLLVGSAMRGHTDVRRM